MKNNTSNMKVELRADIQSALKSAQAALQAEADAKRELAQLAAEIDRLERDLALEKERVMLSHGSLATASRLEKSLQDLLTQRGALEPNLQSAQAAVKAKRSSFEIALQSLAKELMRDIRERARVQGEKFMEIWREGLVIERICNVSFDEIHKTKIYDPLSDGPFPAELVTLKQIPVVDKAACKTEYVCEQSERGQALESALQPFQEVLGQLKRASRQIEEEEARRREIQKKLQSANQSKVA